MRRRSASRVRGLRCPPLDAARPSTELGTILSLSTLDPTRGDPEALDASKGRGAPSASREAGAAHAAIARSAVRVAAADGFLFIVQHRRSGNDRTGRAERQGAKCSVGSGLELMLFSHLTPLVFEAKRRLSGVPQSREMLGFHRSECSVGSGLELMLFS